MGPRKAAEQFLERHPEAASFEVTLYGSLAATGKGHMTDVAILDVLQPHAPVEILWKPHVFFPFHPNGMTFKSFDTERRKTDEWTVFSVGGGALAEEGHPQGSTPDIYEMNTMSQILYWCEHTGRSYWEYVEQCEGKEIWDYLAEVWKTMQAAILRGLDAEGVLPGPLNLRRSVCLLHQGERIQRLAPFARIGVRLRLGSQRRERIRWENRYGSYLWRMRRSARRALPPATDP